VRKLSNNNTNSRIVDFKNKLRDLYNSNTYFNNNEESSVFIVDNIENIITTLNDNLLKKRVYFNTVTGEFESYVNYKYKYVTQPIKNKLIPYSKTVQTENMWSNNKIPDYFVKTNLIEAPNYIHDLDQQNHLPPIGFRLANRDELRNFAGKFDLPPGLYVINFNSKKDNEFDLNKLNSLYISRYKTTNEISSKTLIANKKGLNNINSGSIYSEELIATFQSKSIETLEQDIEDVADNIILNSSNENTISNYKDIRLELKEANDINKIVFFNRRTTLINTVIATGVVNNELILKYNDLIKKFNSKIYDAIYYDGSVITASTNNIYLYEDFDEVLTDDYYQLFIRNDDKVERQTVSSLPANYNTSIRHTGKSKVKVGQFESLIDLNLHTTIELGTFTNRVHETILKSSDNEYTIRFTHTLDSPFMSFGYDKNIETVLSIKKSNSSLFNKKFKTTSSVISYKLKVTDKIELVNESDSKLKPIVIGLTSEKLGNKDETLFSILNRPYKLESKYRKSKKVHHYALANYRISSPSFVKNASLDKATVLNNYKPKTVDYQKLENESTLMNYLIPTYVGMGLVIVIVLAAAGI
jgi:hypothetical protein